MKAGPVVASVTLVAYMATLCPTIMGGDSGELIAAAYTLSVAHPPGYPLYVLLTKMSFYSGPMRHLPGRQMRFRRGRAPQRQAA